MKGKKLAALTAVLYVIFLVACSASWLAHFSFKELINVIAGTVPFQEGVFKKSSESLTVVLHDGETAILDEFESLRSADLRGSECIDEIYLWAQENPQVNVRYTVTLPNGLRVENTASSLDFTGINKDNLLSFSDALRHFPAAGTVELGSSEDSPSPLNPDELASLITANPDKTFAYRVTLSGIQISLSDKLIDLSELESTEAERATGYLSCMPRLEKVKLGDDSKCALSLEEIAALQSAAPQADFEYSFELYGRPHKFSDESIDLSGYVFTDKGEDLINAMRCMPQLKSVDLDSRALTNGLSDEEIAAIRDEFPNVEVVWRVWFGQLYSVRTDTERILASKPSVGGIVSDLDVQTLSYCTKVKYLDLGHNEHITDISFVSHMPDLEVFIIAMNYVADISPLADCRKLEYLELNSTPVVDLSPLKDLDSLRHLNISNCYMTDISPLYGLKDLERLWIGCLTPIPAEQVAKMQSSVPGCRISTVSDDPHGDGWRYTDYNINYHTYTWSERYELLREQLGYNYQEYSFYWLDPKSGLQAPPEYAGTYYIHPDQLSA